MLYKTSTGKVFIPTEKNTVVALRPNGTVKVHIGKLLDLNYISKDAFDESLVSGKNMFFMERITLKDFLRSGGKFYENL